MQVAGQGVGSGDGVVVGPDLDGAVPMVAPNCLQMAATRPW